MRVVSKAKFILHFDPLLAIFLLTRKGFSKLFCLRDLIAHQMPNFKTIGTCAAELLTILLKSKAFSRF